MIISNEQDAKNVILGLLGKSGRVLVGAEAIRMGEYIRISKDPSGIHATEHDSYSRVVMVGLFTMDFDECKQFVVSKIREGYMGCKIRLP